MEITPASPTSRTTKVRTTKPVVPKSSASAKKPVLTKALVTKPVEAKPVAAKPKAAAAPRKAKPMVSAEATVAVPDLTPMIATAAYYLAEQRHFAHGYEMQDWLAAEQLIRGSTLVK